MKRGIAFILLAVGLILLLYVSIVVRFQNPDWTETRLLLETWPICLAGVVALLCGWTVLPKSNA